MQFEDLGIFLSFISYPYFKDGKDLYKSVFEPFFKIHKEQLAVYDPDAAPGKDPYPDIYTPAGYRMFSSNGLTILSLVDDYSFYNRFFNKNHIQSLLLPDEHDTDNSTIKKEIDLDFKSVVVSGVTERDETGRSLLQAAKDTFLLPDEKRFQYIGIIRLKIDYRLLVGKQHAITTVRKIKSEIENLFQKQKKKDLRCDYIAIDCYDNDELTVIAFADQLLTLFNLLGNIRSIKNTDIGQHYSDEESGPSREKHIFGLTYLCFGYDLKRGIGKDLGDNNIINCTVETKPGHRDIFYSYLKENHEAKSLEISNLNVNISGGSTVYFSMPLRKIEDLENICKEKNSVFRRDVRQMKVSLKDEFDSFEREKSQISENHIHTNDNKQAEINRKVFSDVKKLMKQVGVSKMVRERLMALLEFYNLSCQNLLQSFYLNELKPALSNYGNIIRDMKDNPKENLNSIEKVLNEEITDMENACYDRLHIQKSNQTPLEYSGGIQQYLTSFDFAYKQIYRVFSPKDNDAFYITISGAERASSERPLFKLNIHDIVFPELFITTAWKEIANFALKTQKENYEKDKSKPHKELVDTLNTWHRFTSNKDAFRIIRDRINQSKKLLHDDEISRCIKRIVSPELIEYYIKDFIVFHFAFCNDFELFWHFYFKTFLQTTNCYNSLNHVDKKNLIHMLLRVFMVAKLADNENGDMQLSPFLQTQATIAFDSIIGAQWMECYDKTLVATDEIYDVLKMYGFCQMIDYSIESYEENIYNKEQHKSPFDINNMVKILEERLTGIKIMVDSLEDGYLVSEDPNYERYEYSFLFNLLGAYLRAVFELDFSGERNRLIKCIPRNRDGMVNEAMKIDHESKNDIYESMIKIPVDTTGGFFIPSSNSRRMYFRLRTTLYRSLWNYRFACENN